MVLPKWTGHVAERSRTEEALAYVGAFQTAGHSPGIIPCYEWSGLDASLKTSFPRRRRPNPSPAPSLGQGKENDEKRGLRFNVEFDYRRACLPSLATLRSENPVSDKGSHGSSPGRSIAGRAQRYRRSGITAASWIDLPAEPGASLIGVGASHQHQGFRRGIIIGLLATSVLCTFTAFALRTYIVFSPVANHNESG